MLSLIKPVRKNITRAILLVALTVIVFAIIAAIPETVSAATNTYTISTKTKPCYKSYRKLSYYNRYTKNSVTLRSYMRKMQKHGGGKLIIKKGTYNLSLTVYVPKNVKIVLNSGAVLKKTSKTGRKKTHSEAAVFKLIRPTKAYKKNAVGGYGGEKDISFSGGGTFDLNKYNGSIAIVMGHNLNVSVTGIHFKNMKNGHFIEMDASKNVNISNCTFDDNYGTSESKEAINIDTPDNNTHGFGSVWSKHDKTPNYNINISGCRFSNMFRAVGTHMYSTNKYHKKIIIKDCVMTGMKSHAIKALNWQDYSITNNIISGISSKSGKGIRIAGCKNIHIVDNTISHYKMVMWIAPSKNVVYATDYPTTYNDLSEEELKSTVDNTFTDYGENFIRCYSKYNDYTSDSLEMIFFAPGANE